jgi:hypothetical protein
MLALPAQGYKGLAASQTSTSADGTTVTASGTTFTFGSWAQLIASTSFTAYGIFVLINNTGVASANHRVLVDIGIGGSGSETTLIPYLDGHAGGWANTMGGGQLYFFPILIPSGTRLSARCMANTASKNAYVLVWLVGQPMGPNGWYGSRVTAYGVNAGTAVGTAITPGGTSAYGTAVQLTASTSAPIRMLQFGMDLGTTDTTGSNMRGMVRFGTGATPDYFVSGIPFAESTTLETMDNRMGNFVLSHMMFNIPSGTELRASAMVSGTAEARTIIAYGVD